MIGDKRVEQMMSWRHHLHQHPEYSIETKETARFIAGILRSYGYEVTEGVGGVGVVAKLQKGTSSKSIGIRADMDALKIREKTNLPYASVNGMMHACGHDGHIAMLLGAAAEIAENCTYNGSVYLVFQPGEETTIGAKAMVEDGLFQRFPMNEIYGLHNVPFQPFGSVSTRVGGLMSSEDNFKIVIKGGGCHAASPQEGVDPFLCFSQIYPALQSIVSRNCSPTHSVVLSCTELTTDGARNAIPNSIEIRGDVRCFRPEDQKLVEKRMREICESICKLNGAEAEVAYTHECASVQNDAGCVKNVCDAAEKLLGEENVDRTCEPWMASEDFSEYLQQVPGCFFLLGSGKKGDNFIPLHSAEFDFDDKLLPIGAELWRELVSTRLGE